MTGSEIERKNEVYMTSLAKEKGKISVVTERRTICKTVRIDIQ